MRNHKFWIILAALGLFLVGGVPVSAAPLAGYTIDWWTVDGGGGGGASYRLFLPAVNRQASTVLPVRVVYRRCIWIIPIDIALFDYYNHRNNPSNRS